MHDPTLSCDENFRSDRYLIACASHACARCAQPTRLVAIALPVGHRLLVTMEEDGERCGSGAWQDGACNALVFYVGALPDAVPRRLRELAPGFKLAADLGSLDAYWSNHCEHCGLRFADEELFCEPEGAFMPASSESAATIRLEAVDEPIALRAAGYAPEPGFFALLRQR